MIRRFEMIPVAANDEQVETLEIVIHTTNHLGRAFRLELDNVGEELLWRNSFEVAVGHRSELGKVIHDVLAFDVVS